MTPATSDEARVSGFAPAFRRRDTARALILSPDPALLLIHLVVPDRKLWITPGGGIAPGESHLEALRRELEEELGRADLEIGPQIWFRNGRYRWAGQWVDERERFYLVRADRFEPDMSRNPAMFEREAMAEVRWWPVSELPAESKLFAPMRLGFLVKDLIERGLPSEPIETGF
jgi:8-oxo-dGTP pyrophosphatase MutT (NUDIX family)